LLKIEYGLSNQEIADRMGITVPTVKSHYTQAIKALRNAIESLIMWFPVIWIYLID
jgi:RNA polymerase ECF-type sigma factor